MITTFRAALLVSLLSSPAFAGPDATTQYLMDTPPTMLDLGILASNMVLVREGLGSMSYNWDANRFRISEVLLDETIVDEKGFEANCAAWIARVRAAARLNAIDGMPTGQNSRFADFFSHQGFESSKQPQSLLEDLDNLIELVCFTGAKGNLFVVKAPLLGTSYSVERSAPQQ